MLTYGYSPLLENFEAFYYELLRQKERALRMSEPYIQHDEKDDEQVAANEALTGSIQERFRAFFNKQLIDTTRYIEMGATRWHDAQYLMVILADEIFLTLSWPGVKYWERSLLEAQIFHMQIAGELFFKKLDLLLEAIDPSRHEMASLYFFVLTLGFRGKYRGTNNQLLIQAYIKKLYTIIVQSPPRLYLAENPQLVPSCYEHTAREILGRRLPDARVWGWCLFSIIVTYVFVTYVVWYHSASDMHNTLERLFENVSLNDADFE